MKQIDYLKLVATGRKSIHYARPSDADDALSGLVGYGFACSLLLTFAIAILASYLGATIDADDVGWALAATVLPGIALFIGGFLLAGAPRFIRICFSIVSSGVAISLTLLAITGRLDNWFLFVPPFLYAVAVSVGATRQL